MTERIRVLIADDQALLRHSLRVLVGQADGLEVIGEAATGVAALASVRELRPDVVLMDVRMPELDGIAATRSITADPTLASCRVLVLTMFELDEYVFDALRAGASGFLLKDARPEALVDAIRRVHAGESIFAPAVLARLVEHYVRSAHQAPTDLAAVTPRELEVLGRIARGRSNHEIAADLTISVKTVQTHIGSLLAKLHARDRAQLVIAAYERGVVRPGA